MLDCGFLCTYGKFEGAKLDGTNVIGKKKHRKFPNYNVFYKYLGGEIIFYGK